MYHYSSRVDYAPLTKRLGRANSLPVKVRSRSRGRKNRRLNERLRNLDSSNLPGWVQTLRANDLRGLSEADPDQVVDVLLELSRLGDGPLRDWVAELEIDDVVSFASDPDSLIEAFSRRKQSVVAQPSHRNAEWALIRELEVEFSKRRAARGGREVFDPEGSEMNHLMRTDGDDMPLIRSKSRVSSDPAKNDEDRQVRRFERPAPVTYRKAA